MSDDGYRYCYTAEDGELVEKRKIADHEVLGMVHYPNANSMLVFSQKFLQFSRVRFLLKIWKTQLRTAHMRTRYTLIL